METKAHEKSGFGPQIDLIEKPCLRGTTKGTVDVGRGLGRGCRIRGRGGGEGGREWPL